MKPYYRFIIILVIVALAAAGADYLARRGPARDAQAVQDLRELQSATDTYYLSQNRLPDNLAQLPLGSAGVKQRLSDYEYRRTGASAYQLCATFQSARTSAGGTYVAPVNSGPDGSVIPNPEVHGRGRQCFTYTEISISPVGPIVPLSK